MILYCASFGEWFSISDNAFEHEQKRMHFEGARDICPTAQGCQNERDHSQFIPKRAFFERVVLTFSTNGKTFSFLEALWSGHFRCRGNPNVPVGINCQ